MPVPHSRWRKRLALGLQEGARFCTCSKPHSIFDVLMKCEAVDFGTAKIRVAETIGRTDLIRERLYLRAVSSDLHAQPSGGSAVPGCSPEGDP